MYVVSIIRAYTQIEICIWSAQNVFLVLLKNKQKLLYHLVDSLHISGISRFAMRPPFARHKQSKINVIYQRVYQKNYKINVGAGDLFCGYSDEYSYTAYSSWHWGDF